MDHHPVPARARLFADLALLGITMLWGTTFVIVKDALTGAGPFTFLALRFSIGALVALAIAGKDLRHGPSVRAGLTLGPLLFAGFALQTVGLAHTTPARSAFITGLMVLVVPLATVVLLRRTPKPWTLVGVGLALIGLWLLTHPRDGEIVESTLLGDVLTFGCALWYGVHLTLNERYAERVRPMAFVAVQLAVIAVLSAGSSLAESQRIVWSLPLLGAIVFCGVFASALAIGIQAWSMKRTTAVRTVLIFSLEPVFAAVLSVALGRESLDFEAVVGGAFVVVAVIVAEAWPYFAARASVVRAQS